MHCDFVVHVNCTIFWSNRCVKVNLDLLDFLKVPLSTGEVFFYELRSIGSKFVCLNAVTCHLHNKPAAQAAGQTLPR